MRDTFLEATRRALRQVISDGQPPNGTPPSDCGGWAEVVRAVYDGYDTDGTPGARRVWGALVKQNKQLGRLLTEDDQTDQGAATPPLFTARDLMATVFQPIRWIVPEILPEGVTLFAGKPKMGKSWLALNLALAVASGGRALGKVQVEPGRVLFLALEDNKRRLHSRVSKLLQDEPCPDRLDLAIDWPRFADDTLGIAWLTGWIEAHDDARLIVVDTLAKVRPPMGKSSSVYEYDYSTVQGLKVLSDRHNIGILIIHHVRKGTADDPLELISGSFGLSGGVDGAIILSRERGAMDAVLHVTGRDVDEKELAMTWAPDLALWTIVGDAAEYRMSKERRQILDVLQGIKDGLSPKEIAEATQKPYGAAKKLLRDMLTDGQVSQSSYGRYISLP